jgi:Zn-dependent protease
MFESLISTLFQLVVVFVAITIHELSHAFVADRLGDPTARLSGRISLNPLKHYDKVGTTLFIVTSVLRSFGFPTIPFGWAKPVVTDPYNLKNPKRDLALISLAGPLSNILLAIIFSVILKIILGPFSPTYFVFNLIFSFIIINISLAIFNLIPIHPLDGGKILVGLLPDKVSEEVDLFLRRYGLILIMFLIFPTFGGKSVFSMIIPPIVTFFLKILLPGA